MTNKEKDKLLQLKPDRRIIANVPDKKGIRKTFDRRNGGIVDEEFIDKKMNIEDKDFGARYVIDYDVKLTFENSKSIKVKAIDISTTGILLQVPQTFAETIKGNKIVHLDFEITPGTMPEGYEMKVSMNGEVVRYEEANQEEVFLGIRFDEDLSSYSHRTRDRYAFVAIAFCLFLVALLIVGMRVESVVYFKFNKWLYLYSILAASFLLSRYFFAMLYKPVTIDKDYTPGVTIIVPCFNEEEWIRRTIIGCIDQNYPHDKLEVIVIDDCSNDNSVQVIKDTIEELSLIATEHDIKKRLSYYAQPQNAGKREAMAIGAEMAKHELIVFVDSDSFLNAFAVRNIVQPFKDANVGGVSGRTDVANTYTNGLTKMQAVRYYVAFRIMKAAEAYFDAVTCLSGPLSCYRKDLVLKYKDAWLNQTFLGQRATFGDDRSMTNFILRHNRTTYQDTAICATIVPKDYNVFLRQQMRWKRSWLRESLIAAKFMWRKEPFMSLFFYMGLLIPIAAPIIVIYNLVYVPIMHRVFPYTFLLGMLLMSFLMSFAQKVLRKSTIWLYGVWFCLYYEAVLLWQMPIAWVTFWKSTWGTRMTPADLLEAAKKKKKAKV